MTAMTDDTLQVPPRTIRDEMIAFAVMALLLAIVPLTGVYPFFVMQALCFALLACAFNLLIGYGGLLSFGHAMFLGTAGYCTAHALKVWGVSPELGILVGIAGAAALSVITGFISIRRQGIYFSMITLALSQLLYFIYLQAPLPMVKTASRAFRKAICSGSSTSPSPRCFITWCWPVSSPGSS